jgi:hypothetical protein
MCIVQHHITHIPYVWRNSSYNIASRLETLTNRITIEGRTKERTLKDELGQIHQLKYPMDSVADAVRPCQRMC